MITTDHKSSMHEFMIFNEAMERPKQLGGFIKINNLEIEDKFEVDGNNAFKS